MPTERFLRLPKEKIEAIRIAAAKEFMRVPLEEASINRIVHDADISRGSFYTYFEDKQDLLKWLIYAQAEQLHDTDVRGDIYEFLLSKIATAGVNGQRNGSYGAGRSDQYFSESDQEREVHGYFQGRSGV